MKKHVRLFLLALVLTTTSMLPVNAFQKDLGGDGGSGGSTTCAVQCPDGSWSGIACNTGETAHCTCGGSPVRANPYCS